MTYSASSTTLTGTFLKKIAQSSALVIPITMYLGNGLLDTALSLVSITFLLYATLTNHWQWLKIRWVQLAGILWAYLVIRNGFSLEPLVSLGRALPWIRFPLLTVALSEWIFRDSLFRRRFLQVWIGAVAFGVFDTLWQYWAGTDLIFHHPFWLHETNRLTGPLNRPVVGITTAWLGLPLIALSFSKLLNRVRWTSPKFIIQEVKEMNYLAGTTHPPCEPSLSSQPLSTSSQGKQGSIFHNFSLLAGILLILATVWFSGDRGGWVQAMIGLGIMMWVLSPSKKIFLFIIVAGSLFLMVLIRQNPAVVERQVTRLVDTVTHFAQSDYGYVYQGGLEVFKKNPVFGIGLKRYREVCFAYVPPQDNGFTCSIHPHNIYLEWLAESGLVGFCLWILILKEWAFLLWQRRQGWVSQPLLLGTIVVLGVRLFPVLPSGSFFMAWAAIPVWLWAGWVFSQLLQDPS